MLCPSWRGRREGEAEEVDSEKGEATDFRERENKLLLGRINSTNFDSEIRTRTPIRTVIFLFVTDDTGT